MFPAPHSNPGMLNSNRLIYQQFAAFAPSATGSVYRAWAPWSGTAAGKLALRHWNLENGI